jgi:chemotaxis protein CheD
MKTYKTLPDTETGDNLLIRVSEYGVVDSGETLVAYGLGACVAIALYAPTGVGGLAHAMLPRKADGAGSADGKFVDSAIHAMLREIIETGAGYGTIEARIAGGADIFHLDGLASDAGKRNVEAARDELEALGVPIVGEDVGGGRGRRVEFDTASGDLVVHTVDSDAIRL